MLRESSTYEVRCPRCDVSFPPETRKCIHCGGPTGNLGSVVVPQWTSGDARESSAQPPSPIEPEGEPIFTMGSGEAEEGDVEPQSSLPRTLFRSFGSLIWIGLLIAFTLARDCGGE